MKLKLYLVIFLILLFEVSAQQKIYEHPGWSYNKTIYEANIRQYSEEGTFNKFRESLPALKEMGIGIIWLMPVNPIGEKNRKGTMGSYYSIKDYLDVNPEFGTKEDFKSLVEEIHENDMYVIIDWVANHSSWDNTLTKEHPEWFTKDSSGNFAPPVDDWSDVIDLDYSQEGLRNYMTNALLYWVKEFDIDGYRCDVAEMVPLDFWINARKELDKIKPVFMLAEGEKAELHEAFDMTYSWDVFHIMRDIAKGKRNSSALIKYLDEEKNQYPPDAFRMRFTTNHDENSWNGTDSEMYGDGAESFAVLSALIPGMPLVYSGQEAGLDKRLEFFEKDPIDWKEDRMRDIYTKLFNLKETNPALFNGERGGELTQTELQDSLGYALVRSNGEDKVIGIFNFSGEERSLKINNISGNYKDLFNENAVKLNGSHKFNLKAWEYKVLITN